MSSKGPRSGSVEPMRESEPSDGEVQWSDEASMDGLIPRKDEVLADMRKRIAKLVSAKDIEGFEEFDGVSQKHLDLHVLGSMMQRLNKKIVRERRTNAGIFQNVCRQKVRYSREVTELELKVDTLELELKKERLRASLDASGRSGASGSSHGRKKADIIPKKEDASPLKHKASPLKHKASPMKNKASPMKNKASGASPMKNKASPMKMKPSGASPMKRKASPVKRELEVDPSSDEDVQESQDWRTVLKYNESQDSQDEICHVQGAQPPSTEEESCVQETVFAPRVLRKKKKSNN